jgi:hypothetical protein
LAISPFPGHARKFIDRGDQEAGQPLVDRLVDHVDRQRPITGKLAMVAQTGDPQLFGWF